MTAEARKTATAAYPQEHGEGRTPLVAEEEDLEAAPGQGSSERAQASRASRAS